VGGEKSCLGQGLRLRLSVAGLEWAQDKGTAMQEDLLAQALAWHRAGRGVAIATVVETWGSAPRQAGSVLIIDENGVMAGSVSGGCVEGAVVAEALDALPKGIARLLDFGVADEE